MKIAYVTHFTYILISSVALVGAEKVESACVVRCLNRVIPGDADGHRARQTASGESSRGTGAQYEPLTTAEIPDRCLSQRVMATAGGNVKKATRRLTPGCVM
jgi:hypothetical protein